MKFTSIRAAVIAATIAAGATLPALAGIKYWDNPAYKAYDVGDYAPGAYWNFDGIRNVGADQQHSTTATTWKNLGTGGSTYDTTPIKKGSGPDGEWTADGYEFKGGTRWYNGAQVTVSGSWTVQMLVDVDADNLLGDAGPVMSAMWNYFAFIINKSSGRFYANLNSGNTQPYLLTDSHEYDYATVILDNENLTATMFSGTTPPTSGNGYKTFSSALGGGNTTGWGLGSTSSDGQQLVGILKTFRWYQRILSKEELAWNRVVDEARFFNRVAPLPITNVVVATSVAGANGGEPAGYYAVDGRHAFIAPATVTVGGVDYVCTGYTLETRDGEGWSAPVFHKAALFQPCACVVTEGECVRLTWQWAKAAGLANLGYDVGDYVWDGLKVFYDGICNVGTNLPHSYSATNWVNLGAVGAINDVFVQRLKLDGSAWVDVPDLSTVGVNDPGYWTENGFTMNGTSRFRCNAPGGFTVGTSYSLQMLIDAKASDQVTANIFLLGANYHTFAFWLQKSDGTLFWKIKSSKTPTSWAYMTGGVYDYLTAIARDNNTQKFFDGTTEPTSGTGSWDNDSVGFSETGFCLGGYGKSDTAYTFVGTMKNFRQYDHALSAAEVAQNRKVDNWRYFGIPDNPNVVVQSTVPYLRGEEPDGSYAVDGSHTFTAPATVTYKGIDYVCDGYTVETWDGSAWANAASYASCSFAYTVGTSPARVRLTWKWKATHGLRTAADYSFDDYSQAGLVWNYDGIRNRGYKDSDHYSAASTWKNLGSGGSQFDLSFKAGTTTTGAWADDGYIFRDGPRFWSGAAVGPIKSFTLQTLVDADIASQPAHTHSYIMSVKTDSFNMSLVSPTYNGSEANSICWTAQGGIKMYFHAKDLHYTYATAMMDFDAKTAMMFPGTTIPAEDNPEGTYGAQRLFHQYTSVSPVSDTGYGIGNANSANQNGMNGKIKNFRYYDRVLTQEELVRNRNVDAVRYFGELGVTNVFVVAGGEGAVQTESGAYKVEGEWTFTATTTVNESGATVPVVRYAIQTLSDGVWSGRKCHDGNSYTYTEGTSPATVRLTWLGQPAGMMIIVR